MLSEQILLHPHLRPAVAHRAQGHQRQQDHRANGTPRSGPQEPGQEQEPPADLGQQAAAAVFDRRNAVGHDHGAEAQGKPDGRKPLGPEPQL